MRQIVHTSQFKRDYRKKSQQRIIDQLLTGVINNLAAGERVEARFRDHPLKGGYAGCRECHLKPDLLLIYVQTPGEVRLIRLGSHAELFD
jgi:mRNA interferase YafQ